MLHPLLLEDAEKVSSILIAKAGSLAAVLSMPPRRLARLLPGQEQAVALIVAARAAMLHSLRARALEGPVIRVGRDLLDYLTASLAEEPNEQLRVIFLDSGFRVKSEEIVQRGTINELAYYPREIVAAALEHGAARIILVHNHPSGDPHPSKADYDGTRKIADACAVVGIKLWDHIIVGRAGVTSLRSLGHV